MNSSCPTVAFVLGVKTGSGSWEPSESPSGSGTPEMVRGCLVGVQAEPGEIAAGDALHREHVQAAAADRPPGPFGRHVGGGDHVVGHQARELVEPPQGELGEDLALVRDQCGQHDVVDADLVRGDKQDVVAIGVDVADLAGVQ